MSFSLFVAALAVTPALPADDVAVAAAMFELCPRILDGTIALDNPQHLAAIGYVPSRPHGKAVWVRGGPPEEPVFLAAASTENGRTCAVTFVDDAAHSRFDRMNARARTLGYQGAPAGPPPNAPKARTSLLRKDGDTLMILTIGNHIELGEVPSGAALFNRRN